MNVQRFAAADRELHVPANFESLEAEFGRPMVAAVDAALSMVIGGDRGENPTVTARLARAAAISVRTPSVSAGGLTVAPLVADAPITATSYQAATFRLSISRQAVSDIWADELYRNPGAPALPRWMLAAFFSDDTYRNLCLLALDGPEAMALRLSSGVQAYIDGRLDGGTRGLAYGRLLCSAGRSFMTALVKLRRGLHADVLAAWDQVPAAPRLVGGTSPRRKPTPTLEVTRTCVNFHLEAVYKTMRIRSIAQIERRVETAGSAAFGAMSARWFGHFVLLILFLMTGGRVSAVCRLTRGDVRLDATMLDGRVGNLLVLRPGKTLAADVERSKPLCEGLAELLRGWMAFTERRYGHRCPDDPLIPLGRRGTPLTPHATAAIIGGKWFSNPEFRRKPMLPLDSDVLLRERTEIRPEDVLPMPTLRARSFVQQLVRAALNGSDVLAGLPATPADVAEVLVDHDRIASDPYGYHSISTPEGRELYAGIAVKVLWDHLMTPVGARTAPDGPAIAKLVGLEKALCDELDALFGAVEGDERQQQVIALSDEVSNRDVLAYHELHRLNSRRHRRAAELGAAVAQTQEELVALRTDERRWIALPDDLPGEKLDVEEAREEAVLSEAPDLKRSALAPKEFAEYMCVSLATVHRWLNGKFLGHPGDPTKPWSANSVPSAGEGTGRLIPLSDVRPASIPDDPGNARLRSILNRRA